MNHKWFDPVRGDIMKEMNSYKRSCTISNVDSQKKMRIQLYVCLIIHVAKNITLGRLLNVAFTTP